MLSSTALFSLSSHTSLFSKAELPHKKTSLISIPHLKLLSSHCPHLLTHYFTDSSSANPIRCVTVTQCFTRQPPTSFSVFSTEFWRYSLYLSYLYIWFVGNSKAFRIFYIESKIGDEISGFFFPPFFSLFDVWVFASNLNHYPIDADQITDTDFLAGFVWLLDVRFCVLGLWFFNRNCMLFDLIVRIYSLCCFKWIFARLKRWWFLGIGKYALFLIQLSKCKNWFFFRHCRYFLILLDIFLSFENY